MPRYISVPVLWNENGTFQGGSTCNIETTSRYVGAVQKPLNVYPPNSTPTLTTTLQVESPTHGTLYLNMPYQSYQDAIRAASGSASPLVMTLMTTISGSTTTITDSSLSGAVLVAVWVGGAEIDLRTLTLAGDTLTFPFSLSDSDVVGIIYYIS